MFKLSNLLSVFDLNFKVLITKSSKDLYTLYMYNNNFYFLIKLSSAELKCNPFTFSIYTCKLTNVVEFINKNKIKTSSNLYFDKLNLLLFSWNSYFFKKFIIDGKAYRINKFKKGNFKLLFGRSHKTLFICKNVFLKKKKKIKKKFMFYCSNYTILNHASNITYRVRPNDIYTARGIRASKQISRRKLGKKGATSVI